jgi:hypothetical protein
MPRNRLPRVMKHYFPAGRRNYGRPLKRLLDTWDRDGSTSGPTPWQIYDDDDDCLYVSSIPCTPLSMAKTAQISSTMGVQIYNNGFGSSSSRLQNLLKWPTFENIWRFHACLTNCWRKWCKLVKTAEVQILPASRPKHSCSLTIAL